MIFEPFEWTQVDDNDWLASWNGFGVLVAYDDEFGAFEWTVRVEQTQRVFASGMSRYDDEARHSAERAIRMHVTERVIDHGY